MNFKNVTQFPRILIPQHSIQLSVGSCLSIGAIKLGAAAMIRKGVYNLVICIACLRVTLVYHYIPIVTFI